jgi:hypothetical protein
MGNKPGCDATVKTTNQPWSIPSSFILYRKAMKLSLSEADYIHIGKRAHTDHSAHIRTPQSWEPLQSTEFS